MKKLDFFLSASLALAACHNPTAKTAPTSTQLGLKADSPETGHSANVLPQNDRSEDATKSAKAIKDKVSALIAEQKELIGKLQKQKMLMADISFCEVVTQECFNELGALSKKNIPADAMAACPGTFDPNDTCIDDKMIEKGLGNALIEVYEAGNACLHQEAVECPPKAKKARKIMDDPAFKAKEKRQYAIQKDLNMRSSSGGQSQTDWKACKLVADKITGGESDKRRKAFYDSPTTEAYGVFMQAETATLQEKAKCTDKMEKEAKRNPEIAQLLKQTRANLFSSLTEEFLTCTQKDLEYKKKDQELEDAVDAYVKNPTIDGRVAYLQAEMAKFDRRRACEKELAGKGHPAN